MKGINVVLRDGGSFNIPEDLISYWESIYPELDVRSEIGYLKEMWLVEAIPRRTSKNIIKHINKWLYSQSNEEID